MQFYVKSVMESPLEVQKRGVLHGQSPGDGAWRQQQQMLRILGAEDVAQEVLLAAAQEVLRQQGEEVRPTRVWCRSEGSSDHNSLSNGVRWFVGWVAPRSAHCAGHCAVLCRAVCRGV